MVNVCAAKMMCNCKITSSKVVFRLDKLITPRYIIYAAILKVVKHKKD